VRAVVVPRILAACGGFLVAVLWFDFMFDVQVLAYDANAPVPEAVVASIATYYRRVTTDAFPMNRLIGLVMLVTVAGSIWQLARGGTYLWSRLAALLLVVAPVGLAGLRVLPNAVRLGARADTFAQQCEIARTIAYDHAFCLVAMTAFVIIQCGTGWRGQGA
jgi:hypothetical protein